MSKSYRINNCDNENNKNNSNKKNDYSNGDNNISNANTNGDAERLSCCEDHQNINHPNEYEYEYR